MEPSDLEEGLSRAKRGEPRRAEPDAALERGTARGAKPPSGSSSGAIGAVPRSRGDVSRRYSAGEKKGLVAAYAVADAAGETMDAFARRHGVSTASLCKWRKALRTQGEAGLDPKPNPRNHTGPHRGQFSYTPEQRRAAVEAFLVAGQTVEDFARLWGVSRATLSVWVRAYRRDGPKALEPKRKAARSMERAAVLETSSEKREALTRPDLKVARRLAAPVRALIARTRDRFAHFGLKKIRDYLLRFHGVSVSTGGVKSALIAEGRPATQPTPKKVRRAPPAVRFFERAKPMQLWQTDITSFLIGPQKQRAYLTVFLDDMSRFIVSFALHLQQKSELVIEALKDGIARYGKPQEILSDQGRQYFSWRGKSEFQKLLKREGIRHVVARSHHPQTVGKCERLWETVKRELLDRILLADLHDARTRLAHYVAHYNFFRPHQGIAGLVPADRFFGAQQALREAQEKQLSAQELSLAVGEAPRSSVFLFGQIGEEKVALHGERGRLVIQTEDGGRREMSMHELGASAPAKTATAATVATAATGERDERRAIAATNLGDQGDVREHEERRAKRGDDDAERAGAGGDAEHGGERDESSERRGGAVDAERAAAAAKSVDVGGRVAAGGERGDGERGDGERDRDASIVAGSGVGSDIGAARGEAPASPRLEAGEVSASAAAAGAGALAVGGGERGGEAAGAPELLGDACVLAGEDLEERGGGAASSERAAGVAAQPTGAGRDGGGALEAAADAADRDSAAGSGGGSGDAQAQDRLAAAGGGIGGAAGVALEGVAGASSERGSGAESPERSECREGDAGVGERREGGLADTAQEERAWPTRGNCGAKP